MPTAPGKYTAWASHRARSPSIRQITGRSCPRLRAANSSVRWQNSPSLAVTGGCPPSPGGPPRPPPVLPPQALFVRRLGPPPGLLVPQDLVDDVLGLADERLDAVH